MKGEERRTSALTPPKRQHLTDVARTILVEVKHVCSLKKRNRLQLPVLKATRLKANRPKPPYRLVSFFFFHCLHLGGVLMLCYDIYFMFGNTTFPAPLDKPSGRWGQTLCPIDPQTAILIGGQGSKMQFCKDPIWKLCTGKNVMFLSHHVNRL